MIRLVTDYLDYAAEHFPDKEAFIDENKTLTFSDLQIEAQRIATQLAKRKVFKKSVAVFLNKSVKCISAFMGIAYSGSFYTPIDTSMPMSRVEKILETLQPEVIITDKKHKEDIELFFHDIEILVYEDLMTSNIDGLLLKQVTECIIDADVLYVLFTSGLTGVPKGVIISHKSVIDYTEWVTETFKIDDQHIFGNQAPFYFDNSVLDIYQTLKNGACMYIIPEQLFSFPIKLLEFLDNKKINTIFWVPSALCLVANLRALHKLHVKSLNKILFAGEVMPNKQLNMWRSEYPEALFANLYGPTEITDVCTYYIVNRDFKDSDALPIGHPCLNTSIMVLNDKNELVRNDAVGELCVRGTSLSYGYYNNQAKTSEVFVQNPLNKNYREIIYRTGDLVRYNEYGELIYVSRKDFQIKHIGHRIELGEIETAISAIQGIETACCIYDENRSKIVMFYTGDVIEDMIIKTLNKTLPVYMLPNKKIKLDKMPLNLNGKIDRVKLKELL
ncbi:amino acid adenylation domain-containing protein [Phascolarctobacterium faecium]|uniref:amino acid adenylation domain-containing protein n=1 Tax=Phascolarctobacterium faecium TaxID=33025 RepID=UPI003F74388D